MKTRQSLLVPAPPDPNSSEAVKSHAKTKCTDHANRYSVRSMWIPSVNQAFSDDGRKARRTALAKKVSKLDRIQQIRQDRCEIVTCVIEEVRSGVSPLNVTG